VLHYLVRAPLTQSARSPKYSPLLILLHGIGSNEEDLFSLANQLPAEMLIVSARAPYQLSEGSYAWYQIDYSTPKRTINTAQAEWSRTVLDKFIEQLIAKYPVDTREVYLMGFSQGAIMSYNLALTEPKKIKAVVSLSGRLQPEITSMVATAQELKHLHFFIAHGTEDHVIEVEEGRAAAQFCRGLHIPTIYKEYPMGHQIDPHELTDITNWLKKVMSY
jgi:phospholipase/carboxylesterase